MATKQKPKQKPRARPVPQSRSVPGKQMPVTVRDPLVRRIVK